MLELPALIWPVLFLLALLMGFPELPPIREAEPSVMPDGLQLILVVMSSLLIVWESARLMRGYRLRHWREHLLAADYQPASSAALLGITISAVQSRHVLLRTKPEPMWIRYFFGGILMGLGAALVPGGNDMLLFNGMPGLSLHALPAYLAMLLGIGVSLKVIMKFFPEQEIC